MRWLIFSNVYIAGAALLLTQQSRLQLGTSVTWGPLVGLVFCATLLVYNLDRLSEAADEDRVDASERHRWIRQHRSLLLGFAGSAGLGACVALSCLPLDVWLALAPLGVLSVAYSLPLLWGPDGPYRLKEIPGLKIVLIACVWAGATALLPAVETSEPLFRTETSLLIAERAIYIFALTLPFDIRDLERDRASDIQTIPLGIGVAPSKWLAMALLVVFGGLAVLHHGATLHGPTLPLVVSALATAAAVGGAGLERGELYYVGLLDGMMPLQWALVTGWSTW